MTNKESKNIAIDLETKKGQAAIPDDIKVYALWDDTNIYFAAVVHDPVHFNKYTGDNLWNGDAFEFDVGFNFKNMKDRNRVTFALNNKGKVGGNNYRTEIGVNGAKADDQDTIVKTKAKYQVSRKGEYTTYEVSFKWTDVNPSGKAESFLFLPEALAATDGDYLGCIGWRQSNTGDKYTLGIAKLAGGNNSNSSSSASSSGNTSSGQNNPATGDNIAIYVLLLCVSALMLASVKYNTIKR
jgi:hypothetical protein